MRKFQSAFALLPKSVTEATDQLGQSCPLISSFPSALHSLLKFTGSYSDSIVDVLRAGGDNAGRAAVVGSWLGAHVGVNGISEDCRKRLTQRAFIQRCVESIVEFHGRHDPRT